MSEQPDRLSKQFWDFMAELGKRQNDSSSPVVKAGLETLIAGLKKCYGDLDQQFFEALVNEDYRMMEVEVVELRRLVSMTRGRSISGGGFDRLCELEEQLKRHHESVDGDVEDANVPQPESNPLETSLRSNDEDELMLGEPDALGDIDLDEIYNDGLTSENDPQKF